MYYLIYSGQKCSLPVMSRVHSSIVKSAGWLVYNLYQSFWQVAMVMHTHIPTPTVFQHIFNQKAESLLKSAADDIPFMEKEMSRKRKFTTVLPGCDSS